MMANEDTKRSAELGDHERRRIRFGLPNQLRTPIFKFFGNSHSKFRMFLFTNCDFKEHRCQASATYAQSTSQ